MGQPQPRSEYAVSKREGQLGVVEAERASDVVHTLASEKARPSELVQRWHLSTSFRAASDDRMAANLAALSKSPQVKS